MPFWLVLILVIGALILGVTLGCWDTEEVWANSIANKTSPPLHIHRRILKIEKKKFLASIDNVGWKCKDCGSPDCYEALEVIGDHTSQPIKCKACGGYAKWTA